MASSSGAVTLLIQEAHDLPIQPKFTTFISSNREILSDLIHRYLLIIRRRSADFKDNQTTIYDKALLHLTDDGNDLTSAPAVLLFCKEYLGFDKEDIDETRMLLDRYSILPASLDQGKSISI